MKNPIIVALDVDDVERAKKLIADLSPLVGGFKVGPRLSFRAGANFLRDLSQKSLLFFDHKFFDIPSTTVASVKVAAEMGAHWVTVHALNGPECLKELSKLETEIKKTKPEFRILAVTVLTSFSKETLPPVWKDLSLEDSVLALARSAIDSGLKSLVCSPHEIAAIEKQFPSSFLVVPGIRPENLGDDQKRTATPAAALKAGASALVIGRPITENPNPRKAVEEILRSI